MTSKAWLLVLLLAVIGAGAFFAFPRWESSPPQITTPDDLTVGRAPVEIEISVEDTGAGLRSLEIRLTSAAGVETLVTRDFPGSVLRGGRTHRAVVPVHLDIATLRLPDGRATLTVTARDFSLRDGFSGNRAEETATVLVDTVAPKVSTLSGLTYIRRGGAGAVVYRVGPDATRHGVRVADAYFPGHPFTKNRSDLRVAIFAVPVDAPRNPPIRVVARDAAGNERSASFPARVLEREFETRTLSLSRAFLEQRVRPLALANGFGVADLSQAFRDVNEKLRKRNELRIRELLGDDPVRRRFHGAFEQMRGSKVTSGFAEQRHYLIDQREVSGAIHYGFDLASTAGARVTAANAGVVAFAGDLGIYGNCVIVDHGLGVRSLYGHLSETGVARGDDVEKGALLGRSGMTGLAGGDHLHFAILVGGAYVDPLEWWDAKWIESHIEARLTEPESPATDSTARLHTE